jgi:hypothetical protein
MSVVAMADQDQTDTGSLSVWEKFDSEEYRRNRFSAATVSSSSSVSADANPERDTNSWNRVHNWPFWPLLNVTATFFWIYVPLKLLVGDFDRWIVSRVSPSLLWILDYRFFFLLSILAVIFLVAKRWKIALSLFYILFFPAVVVLWKIPRLYYRSQSWNLVIGTIQVVWSIGKSIRFTVVAATAFALATMAIALDGPDEILWSAVVTLLVLWSFLVGRAVNYAFVPSKFVVHQQKILGIFLDNDQLWSSMVALPPAARSPEVTRLEKSQIDQLVNNASMGLAFYTASALWAEKLDKYRKSGASVVFSAFAVVALVVQAVMIFAIVNLGIYRIDETEFVYTEEPNFVTFVRYAFTSMYAGEIEALRPVGTGASVVNVLEAFSCAVIVLVLVVSVIFSFKQTQDNRVAEESIQAMRRKADVFAEKLTGEYSLPLADLLDRVSELGGLFTDWVRRTADIAETVYRNADQGRANEGRLRNQ